MMPVSRNCANDINTVWQNILNYVGEIAFFSWNRITTEVSTNWWWIPTQPLPLPLPPPPLFFTHGSVLSLVYFMLFVQSLHSIARAKLKYLSSIKFYLACFRLSGSKTKHNSMNATWPKSPPFLVFALLLISCHILFCVSLQLFYLQVIFYLTKHFAKENLKKLGLLTKIWIACFNLHFW